MKVMSVNCFKSTDLQSKKSNTGFRHAMRVSICIKPQEGGYQFVQPYQQLYKNLNSKIVRILNAGMLKNLKEVFGLAKGKSKTPTELEEHLVNDLKLLDSDYEKFNTVRTAYRKPRIPYIVTGKDEAIVESILNAKNFGHLKRESILLNGYAKNEDVTKFGQSYKENELDFVTNPINLLRSEDGKEIMLRANFLEKTSKSGKKSYEFESYHFCVVEGSKKLTPEEEQRVKKKSDIDTSNIQRANLGYKLSKYSPDNFLSINDYKLIINKQTLGDTSISVPQLIRGNYYPENVSSVSKPQEVSAKETVPQIPSQNPNCVQLEFDF